MAIQQIREVTALRRACPGRLHDSSAESHAFRPGQARRWADVFFRMMFVAYQLYAPTGTSPAEALMQTCVVR